MGTWCSDSQREVPNLIRLLEEIDFPSEQLEIIAIDDAEAQYKQSPQGQEKDKNIHHVPTIIILKDGKEVNRIIEYPRETLEADIVEILKGDYTPYYNTANQVDERLNGEGLESFINDLDELAEAYKGEPDDYYELNTYSKVLFYSGKQDEAIAVARLNAKLFPQEAYAHAALAKRLHDAGQDGEALQHIQMALELEPEDMEIQDLFDKIGSAE
jgi:tetratricopeptide (TPR) repeat protein